MSWDGHDGVVGVCRRFGVRVLVGARDFSFLQTIHSSSVFTQPCIQRAAVFFPKVKRPGLKVNSPPSSPEVKNKWRYTSAPLYAFTVCPATDLPFF